MSQGIDYAINLKKVDVRSIAGSGGNKEGNPINATKGASSINVEEIIFFINYLVR